MGSSRLSYAKRATRYATEVVAGNILASKWVRLACQRHLDDLVRPHFRWHYNERKANMVCAFAEQMPHEKGELQGQPIQLQDWQCFLLCSIFGWIDEDGIRKYREAFILCPRGQGKSPLAAIIALWIAFFDGEPGAEVYCGATALDQAHEVFRPAKSFVEEVPALHQTADTMLRIFVLVAVENDLAKIRSKCIRMSGAFAPMLPASKYQTVLDT